MYIYIYMYILVPLDHDVRRLEVGVNDGGHARVQVDQRVADPEDDLGLGVGLLYHVIWCILFYIYIYIYIYIIHTYIHIAWGDVCLQALICAMTKPRDLPLT